MGIITGKKGKGMFFSAIALIMLAVLTLVFYPTQSLSSLQNIEATREKAGIISGQAHTITEGYVPQITYLAAYNGFLSMSEYIRQRGQYFANDEIFNATFKEILINGTACCSLPGSQVACDDTDIAQVNEPSIHVPVDQCLSINNPSWQSVMADASVLQKLRQFESISFTALRINTTFNEDYEKMNVHFYQDNTTGPWRVGVNITINYTIFAGDVMVNHTTNVTALFGIEGIQDPLYPVESSATAEDGNVVYANYFNRTNITSWNVSNLYQQIERRLYMHDGNGSNFLNRFFGTDQASECCGVESLINPLIMSSVDGDLEKSYVDWCYYGRSNRCTTAQAGAMWNITCVTTETDGTQFYNFALDSYHADKYNVTGYVYGLGPPPACTETPFPS